MKRLPELRSWFRRQSTLSRWIAEAWATNAALADALRQIEQPFRYSDDSTVQTISQRFAEVEAELMARRSIAARALLIDSPPGSERRHV